jgi:glycine/D-amino acid oxidase-like deaminating enzyme
MIVVGGGVIGVEYACMMATLGVKVTLIEGPQEVLGFSTRNHRGVSISDAANGHDAAPWRKSQKIEHCPGDAAIRAAGAGDAGKRQELCEPRRCSTPSAGRERRSRCNWIGGIGPTTASG